MEISDKNIENNTSIITIEDKTKRKKDGIFSYFSKLNDKYNAIKETTEKVTKSIKIIGKTVESFQKNKELPEELQGYVKTAYKKLYELLRSYLSNQLKRTEIKSIENSFINLGIFFISIVLITEESSLSILLASIALIVTFCRFLYSIIKSIPYILLFLKCTLKSGIKNLDDGISSFLIKTYPPLKIAEDYKNNYKFLSNIPLLPNIIKDFRHGLKLQILSVFLTIFFVGLFFWLFKHLLLINTVSMTFVQLISLPFSRIIGILK